jgi:hypothetical protein
LDVAQLLLWDVLLLDVAFLVCVVELLREKVVFAHEIVEVRIAPLSLFLTGVLADIIGGFIALDLRNRRV